MAPHQPETQPVGGVQVGVGAVIVNDAAQVFLAQRGPDVRNDRGLWDCPGGAVQFGERLTDALKREVLEEHGMVIEDLRLLTVVDHILMKDGQHWVAIVYTCSFSGSVPVIREPEKCTAIGWFDLNALPQPLANPAQTALAVFKQNH